MNDEMLNMRRFFRNRFELLLDNNDADGTGAGDGCALGLREVCSMVASDKEAFPPRYDPNIRWICGDDAHVWFSDVRTYGDVSRLVIRYVDAREACEKRPPNGWVREVVDHEHAVSVPAREAAEYDRHAQ